MSIVSIARVHNNRVDEAVHRAVDLVHGMSIVRPGDCVLIKPNLVKPSPSGSGIITDARLTEAVAKLVLDQNPGQVIIGEGSSVGYDFPGQVDSLTAMEASGTADVARRLGLPMVDLNRDEVVEVHADDAYVMHTFGVAKTAYEADVIIDLPVLKTHSRTGITCGLKNMKGVLPGKEKKRTHRLGLDRGIVDLNRVMKPHLTVVDGLVGRAGTHTRDEDRVTLNCILAGKDVVAVDAVCATVMGFDIDEILHVRLAYEAGLGEADLDCIHVYGERIAAVARPFQPYAEAAKERFGAATIIEKDTCTGCWGEMESAFLYLNEAGFADRLKELVLVMGTPDEVPDLDTTPLIVGKCPMAHRELGVWVGGCPPHGIKLTDAICDALNIDKEAVHAKIEELHAAGNR
ncbi:MAG: DUF362 domain-containing protein [Anaerolineae bacterium]|nr:DUF362 domain-containing protein [Anaerolineae bacterium]